MRILLISNTSIPVYAYGGTERVIWDLGYALSQVGHQVTYLVAAGSTCPFADVLHIDPTNDLRLQIPDEIDIVHFQFKPDFNLDEDFTKPYVVSEHGNTAADNVLPFNSIFVSKNHAERHGSDQFVHNGLNWDAYGPVDFDVRREHHHFLGKAAWRVKNVAGAIDVAVDAGVKLSVLGGTRLNLKRGFRFTWSRRVQFHGMVGGPEKFRLLNTSNGLIFPVRWHEPFGLAVIESLYFGCSVFATPYGALPLSTDFCPPPKLHWFLQFKSSRLTCAPAISMRLIISMLKQWPTAILKSTNRFWLVNACQTTGRARLGVKCICRGNDVTA